MQNLDNSYNNREQLCNYHFYTSYINICSLWQKPQRWTIISINYCITVLLYCITVVSFLTSASITCKLSSSIFIFKMVLLLECSYCTFFYFHSSKQQNRGHKLEKKWCNIQELLNEFWLLCSQYENNS